MSPLADRLLLKLPTIHSAENIIQVLNVIVQDIPDNDLETLYSDVLDIVNLALKREGSVSQLDTVTPLLNLLEYRPIVDKLSISLLLSLEYAVYLAKIKFATLHKLRL